MKTYITGSRRLSNIFWAVAVSLGGLGFFFAGLSSYTKINLLLFSDLTKIDFIPQGITIMIKKRSKFCFIAKVFQAKIESCL